LTHSRGCVECALSLNGEALKSSQFYAENRGELKVISTLQIKAGCGFAVSWSGGK
jgi:hypothetical protein